MELFKGRPESVEGRLPREIRTYDLPVTGHEYKTVHLVGEATHVEFDYSGY